MGRLSGKGLPSRLTAPRRKMSAGPVIAVPEGRTRDADVNWRRWYKTSEWQKLRLRVLKRDGYICQATGVALVGKYPAPNSPVADHKVPHRGDRKLFFDENNVQAVSKAYHDSEKQRLEHAGRR
ncbi:HNH endonuclease [uncultured Roseobacter sp.]|uniref:HNH endonuclease n=1 Tax=uncultured Roseobacter sp. TaxID=114847 RepID=UPI00261CD74B|nr:HNH endonuclease [uncultured Roseobacter sp.]